MTLPTADEHVLDNPVWHALRGPLERFSASVDSKGEPSDPAFELIRFEPEVNIFSAVERVDESTWENIANQIGRDGFCALFRDRIPIPPAGWEEVFRGVCYQMIGRDVPNPVGLEVVLLGAEDVDEMLALTELTEPGPFFPRTLELGRYIGVRRQGRLVAMAGERFRLPGYVEISAVCSHPDFRGEGLAGELTLNVAHAIRSAGDVAFLHVLDENENAIRLYQKLGFEVRRKVDVAFAQWHGPDWNP